MICDNCVKEDVCDQKEVLKFIESEINGMFPYGKTMKEIALELKITTNVDCGRAVKKQTDIFTTRSTENTKNV